MSQGEYIAPIKIEKVYAASEYIHEIFIYGDSLKSYVVAIVVPKIEKLMAKAKALGIDGSPEFIVQQEKIVEVVFTDMNRMANLSKLALFERVKNIKLISLCFAKNKLMTPTMKLIRYKARTYFEKELAALYEIPPMPTPIVKFEHVIPIGLSDDLIESA